MCWLPFCRVWRSINIGENHQGPDFPRWWAHSAPPAVIAIQLPIFTGRKAMGLDVLQEGSVIQWKQYWIKHLPLEFYSQVLFFSQVTSSNHLDSVSQHTPWDTLPKDYLWIICIVLCMHTSAWQFSSFPCFAGNNLLMASTVWTIQNQFKKCIFPSLRKRKFWHNFSVDREALCLFIQSYCNCAGTIPRAELRSVRNL